MNHLKKMKKSFAVSKKKAQEKVDLATNSAKEDWLMITDIREEAKICPQYYCAMIVAKLYYHDKEVALRALRLLELCARTCGIRFREHICKPAIIQSLYHIMKGNATEEVKHALYLLVKEWSYNEFANEPKMALIPVLHYKLHPLWEGEKDDCCDTGKPNINNLHVEHILKSKQKTLIFKIFDEVDKLTSDTVNNPPSKQYYSQASGSSTNSNHLELNHKLSHFTSDSESSDDDYDEEGMIAQAVAESLRDFQSNQPKKPISQPTALNNNQVFLSELRLNIQFRSREHESSLDSDRNTTPVKENGRIELPCQQSSQNSDSVGQQSSSSNPKKKLGKLRSKLDCIVCFEFMSSAIFICENGHSVCGNCNTRLTICPVCKAVIRSRNYLLEELAQTLDELNLSRNTE